MTTSVDLADLASSVENLVTAIDNLLDQQIQLYTTTNPTVTISDANGNPFTVPSYYATVGANAAAVTAMQTQVNANTAAIAAIDTGDTTINANVTALQAQQTTNTAGIATLHTTMGAVQTQQGTNVTNITALQAQVASLQTGGSGTNSTLTALQNQVNTNTSNITALQTQQTTNTNAIAALQSTQAQHTTTLGSLSTTVGTNSTTLGTVQTNLTAMQTQVNTIQTKQGTDESSLNTLTTNLGTLTNTVNAIQTQQTTDIANITALQTSIGSLQTSMTSNNTAVASLTTSVSGVQTTATQNTANIAALQGNVASLSTTVNTLPTPGAYSPPYVSARFFTQVFTDVSGRTVGGISRKTGKLWMNNGGWLSDRLDALEGDTGLATPIIVNNDETLTLSPVTPRYHVAFGSRYPNFANPGQSFLGTSYGGFNTNGDFEWQNGRQLATELNDLALRVPPKQLAQAGLNRVVLGDIGVFLPSAQSVASWTSTLKNNAAIKIMFQSNPIVLGASDMSSTQLAALIGAQPLLMSLTGNEIGLGNATVAVTTSYSLPLGSATTILPMSANYAAANSVLPGRLGGPGGFRVNMTYSGGTCSVAAATPFAANTYIPPNMPFVPDFAGDHLSGTVILALGRTDITAGTLTPAQIFANIQAIVNAIPTVEKRFLILTPTPFASEDNTTVNGKAIAALENLVATAYPNNTLLIRPLLQSVYGNTGNNPATIFGNGTLPATYYTGDNQTLSSTVQGYIMAYVANFLNTRGW